MKSAGIESVPPPRLGGFASGRGFRTTPAVRLFAGDRELPLARWPNQGSITIDKLLAPEDQSIHGHKGSKTGRFTCKTDRLARWSADPDIILHGWWFWDWAESRELVKSIDPQSGEITLEPPFHTYGYRAGQPFHATNLFSEIDQPGEWYLDRATLTLYVHALETGSPPDGLRLSLAGFPAMTLENVGHVRFQGIAWTGGAADGIRLDELPRHRHRRLPVFPPRRRCHRDQRRLRLRGRLVRHQPHRPGRRGAGAAASGNP